ncbi:hypothetical protein A2U01_0094362 [Trifolium medium]|uniref:Uncharacterized protein n=1 Tax=Trifolium medium TaxID=97028 RepID=A0A392UJN2_9FABA|nr:hypothetical protein [Trifolium medium]
MNSNARSDNRVHNTDDSEHTGNPPRRSRLRNRRLGARSNQIEQKNKPCEDPAKRR